MSLPIINNTLYKTKIPSTKKAIQFRPFLIGEEKILLMAKEAGDQASMINAIEQILVACVEDKIDVKALTLYDMEYLFIQLRTVSVGEEEQFRLTCSACETVNEVDFDFKKDIFVEQKDISDLEMIDLGNNIKMKLIHPSIDDIRNVDQNKSEDVSAMNIVIDKILTEDDIILFSEQNESEREAFINRLTRAQVGKIKEFIEAAPQLAANVVYNCGHCNEENKQEIRGFANFFT